MAMALTLLEVWTGSMDELESDELKTTLLEATDDVANETSLDTIGLRWDEMTKTVALSSVDL